MQTQSSTETVTVLLTGRGRGAVATVLLHGTMAAEIVTQRFERSTGNPLREWQLNRPYFGNWRWHEYCEELVICRAAEHTFEIHCHGGKVASEAVIQSLEDAGAIQRSAEEWLKQSVSDKFESVALSMLPQATTKRIAGLLLAQTRGAMRHSLETIQQNLVDEDVAAAKSSLNRLIELGRIGTRLHKPFSVVLVGAPNTGKSSLINALVGFERAIVFDRPGTTRDLVRAETAISGWPIQFVDTAGVRETDDLIEKEGVRLAQEVVRRCDLALVICDLTDETAQKQAVSELGIPEDRAKLFVGTKADAVDSAINSEHACDLVTSAATGQGIDSLLLAITNALVPNPPEPGEAMPLDEHTMSSLLASSRLLDGADEVSISKARKLLSELLT